MKKLFVVMPLMLASCSAPSPDHEKSRSEVIRAEQEFARMAKEQGIAKAFYAFADDSAVIKRGPSLVKGKEAIRDFYVRQKSGELQWSPDFAEVSGDLGYTYGPFTYTEKDSTGVAKEVRGYFHTVWKRQKDGSWKFVWD